MLKDEQIINHPLEQELLLAWWRLRQLLALVRNLSGSYEII